MTISTRPSTLLRTLILTSCLLLIACGKKTPDTTGSPTLDRTALMQLAFPGWTADGARRNWKLRIPSTFGVSTDSAKGQKPELFDAQIDPQFVVRLSDDDATLIVLEQPLADNGEIFYCHGCRVDYGAVQFHRRDNKWFVANRQDYFAEGGQMNVGNFPKIIKLSRHAYALKIDTVYVQSGMEENSTSLYELTINGPVAQMSAPLSINDDEASRPFFDGQDENNTISNCAKLPAKGSKKPLVADGDFECYHLDAKSSLDDKGETPGDMVIQYTGLTRLQDDDKIYRFHQINERMVWRYQNGKYVHVEGKDPTARLSF